MKLVKRILNRSYRNVYDHLGVLEPLFTTEPQKQGSFIIDLLADREKEFDYLSFLTLFAEGYSEEKKKQVKKPVG